MLSRTLHCRTILSRTVQSGHARKVTLATANYNPSNNCIFPFCRTDTGSLLAPASVNRRLLSSQRRKNNNKANGTLLNERLIEVLVRKGGGASADAISVRLVVDRSPDPSSTEVVTLMQAMTTSQELGVDLIGVQIDQDPPVIRAQDFSKLAYRTAKKSSSSKKAAASGAKATKEYKFRAGIADFDLQRKLDNLLSYLAKGHACQVTVIANGRARRQDPEALLNTLKRVQDKIGNAATARAPKVNDTGNYGTLMLQPNNKKPS